MLSKGVRPEKVAMYAAAAESAMSIAFMVTLRLVSAIKVERMG